MALLSRNFNKPGPGVPKDEPRKKGVIRVLEVLARHFGDLIKLNFMYFVCALPSQALLVLTLMYSESALLSIIFGVLALTACIPVGPAKTALYFCITKMLRDDPGYAWHDFKKAFKSNFRNTIIPGIIHELITGTQLLFILSLAVESEAGAPNLGLFLISLVIFNMIAPYYFLQAGYVDLKAAQLLKNSLLLAFAKAPRSIGGALFGGILIFIASVMNLLMFFMLVPILILIGYALPGLFGLSFIWGPVDKIYKIEETIRQRQEDALGA